MTVTSLPLIGMGAVFFECNVDGSSKASSQRGEEHSDSLTSCNVSLDKGIVMNNELTGNAIDSTNYYPNPVGGRDGELTGAGIV
jgi:hypothetical protein